MLSILFGKKSCIDILNGESVLTTDDLDQSDRLIGSRVS